MEKWVACLAAASASGQDIFLMKSVLSPGTNHSLSDEDCSWTADYNCPTQSPGAKGPATNDGSSGYQYCCIEEGWKADPSTRGCDGYCAARGCGWTTEYSCPWQPEGSNGRATNDGSLGYHCCCEAQECFDRTKSGDDCSYLSDKVRYVNVQDITPQGPVYVGKQALPKNLQGVFWLVDDGGDALVSLGGPAGSDGRGECGAGKLHYDDAKGRQCITVSTTRGGGWTYQAVTKPGLSSGPFPTIADKLYRDCGMKWNWCFNDVSSSESGPTDFEAFPIAMRTCVNVMALGSTLGTYKGTKFGGEYWRVETKGLGVIPLPDWVLGNFDMIQVMDADGNKIQPAWDEFAAANDQIVVYDDFGDDFEKFAPQRY